MNIGIIALLASIALLIWGMISLGRKKKSDDDDDWDDFMLGVGGAC